MMTDPKELDAVVPGESKRQREALRRKLGQEGRNWWRVFSVFSHQLLPQVWEQALLRSSQRPSRRPKSHFLRCMDCFSHLGFCVLAEVGTSQTVHHGPVVGFCHHRSVLHRASSWVLETALLWMSQCSISKPVLYPSCTYQKPISHDYIHILISHHISWARICRPGRQKRRAKGLGWRSLCVTWRVSTQVQRIDNGSRRP